MSRRAAVRPLEGRGSEPPGASDWQKVSTFSPLILCRCFGTLVDMVCTRLRQMKTTSVMMLWHHCALGLFKYIAFEKL